MLQITPDVSQPGTKCRFITRKSNLLTPTEPYIIRHIPAPAEDHSRYITQDEGETPELTMRPVSVLLLLSLSAAVVLISAYRMPPTKELCHGNTTYHSCGTACPLSCTNLSRPPKICTMQCVIGCGCKGGYVLLDAKNKTCVHPQDCPKQ
ncbi:hypothetical protein GDO78_001246 [Eleutherodactylus coqui]|uniref:TIL domain-containing protein n=1 Tax=Eleutherodactylus coqui TaxID=57060 RepID=A0A8J6FRH3_ELECQ|nr:hypothetical protein GDO78_001246 [Eleutherodactylus coqui]